MKYDISITDTHGHLTILRDIELTESKMYDIHKEIKEGRNFCVVKNNRSTTYVSVHNAVTINFQKMEEEVKPVQKFKVGDKVIVTKDNCKYQSEVQMVEYCEREKTWEYYCSHPVNFWVYEKYITQELGCSFSKFQIGWVVTLKEKGQHKISQIFFIHDNYYYHLDGDASKLYKEDELL